MNNSKLYCTAIQRSSCTGRWPLRYGARPDYWLHIITQKETFPL